MTERSSHFDQGELNHNPIPLADIAMLSSVIGVLYGTGFGLIYGPQVGAEVYIGSVGIIGGISLGIASSNEAIEFARKGKRIGAYLKALESTLEAAIGLAVAGAAAGFGIAGPEGAIWGAATGGIFAGVGEFGQNMHLLSEAFRERHQIRGNIASS